MDVNFEKVGRTAFVIAQWRAQETESASPLFLDHMANIFLNEQTQKATQKVAQASPSTQFLVRYRTRFFDDLFLQKMDEGVQQFILMGAGLDTRAIRLGRPGVRFFEVEQKHVLEYKRKKLSEHNYSFDNTAFVDADYTKVEFVKMLQDQGFDPNKQTLLLWEGNVFYLEYEHVCAVLTILRDHLASFQITFDYLSKKLISRSTGFNQSGNLLDAFGNMGAPWRTGIDSAKELGDKIGLAVDTDFLIADYVNERNDGVTVDRNLLDDYFIGILSNANSS